MRIDWLLWNERNTEHIARHGIHPGEVDEVLEGEYRTLTTHSGRYLLLGRSAAGRYLAVIFEPLGDGKGLVVTARDMTKTERQRYRGLL